MTRVNVCVRFEDDKRTSDTLFVSRRSAFSKCGHSLLDVVIKTNGKKKRRRSMFHLLPATQPRTKTVPPRAHKQRKKNRTYRWVSPERGLRFASSLSSRYLSPSRFVPRRRSKIAARRSVQSARIASSRRGCTPRSSGPRVKPPAPRRSRRRASRTERFYDRRRRLFLS